MLGSFQKNKKNLVAKFLVSHGKTLKLQLASYVLILFFLNQMLLLKDEIFKCTQHFHSIYFYIQKSRKTKKRKTNKTNKQTNKKNVQLHYFSTHRLTQLYLICRHRLLHAKIQKEIVSNSYMHSKQLYIEGDTQQFIYA